jgi:beta-glucosidase
MRDAQVALLWQVPDPALERKAVAAASASDVAVLVLGLSPRLEGEEMKVPVPGFSGGDRTTLDLPAAQQHLLEAVRATGKPVVLVLLNGSALGTTWADNHVPAIVEAWYPGQAAGTAVADVLFGRYNPAGRLPVTIYRSASDLPPFSDYHMAGRTYRYFTGAPLYPFGHGLSYSTFSYRQISASVEQASRVSVSVEVANTSRVSGDEVVQVYLSAVKRAPGAPRRSLVGFRRVALSAGETKHLTFVLGDRELSQVDAAGRRRIVAGEYEISVGGKQPGFAGHADAATTSVISARITLR